MAKHLECHGSESTNAYELAEIGPYCNGTWKDQERLQKKTHW